MTKVLSERQKQILNWYIDNEGGTYKECSEEIGINQILFILI